jgi:hypothetical protein
MHGGGRLPYYSGIFHTKGFTVKMFTDFSVIKGESLNAMPQ